MTKHRDLKRLVRDRQQRTGESYMTALRHVRSQQSTPIPVLELIDLTEVGEALGFKCRLMVLPELAERIDVTAVLMQLRSVLIATARDHSFELMRSVVLHGERPFVGPASGGEAANFLQRLRAGIGGISESGRMLSFAVAARQAAELVMFVLWITPIRYIDIKPALILTSADYQLGSLERPWLEYADKARQP